MKFLEEYRDPELSKAYLKKIREITTKEWRIMEFCGGQTHSLVKNGIISCYVVINTSMININRFSKKINDENVDYANSVEL